MRSFFITPDSTRKIRPGFFVPCELFTHLICGPNVKLIGLMVLQLEKSVLLMNVQNLKRE